jgi:cell division protein FtsQ
VSPVTTPVDRRFRRAHLKPTHRRWSRKAVSFGIRFVALPLLGLLLLNRLWAGVVGAPALRVRHIAVTGNTRLPTGQVTALLEGLSDEPLMSVDLARWRERLLASPWIADVQLRRRLPATLLVHITEREPIGIARFGADLYLMDERGTVVDEFGPQYGDLDLPLVNGLGAVKEGLVADQARVDLAARVISAVRTTPALAKRLSEVNVADEHNAAVTLTGDRALLHIGTDRFVPRLVAYEEMAQALRQRVQEIDSVDLRFDDRMFVRPAGGSRTAANGADSDSQPVSAAAKRDRAARKRSR